MESPSPAAAEPGAKRKPSPEAPLAAERVGCAHPPPKSEHAEHLYQGHRGRCFSMGTGCAQPRSPAQPGTPAVWDPSGPRALALLLSIP